MATRLHAVLPRTLSHALSRCQKRHYLQCLGNLPPRLCDSTSDQEILRPVDEKPNINARWTAVLQACGFNKQGHRQYR